jgi:saccharopine dehydrogenase (NADP+, L-glutamate forming)
VDIGFLSDEAQDYLKQPIAWKEATQKIINAPSSSEADLVATISSKATFKDAEEKTRLISGLKWSMLPPFLKKKKP